MYTSQTRVVLSGLREEHSGLESEANDPGLQLTIVCTSGARLSPCKSLDLWLLSPLVLCFSSMEFSNIP